MHLILPIKCGEIKNQPLSIQDKSENRIKKGYFRSCRLNGKDYDYNERYQTG